MAKSKTYTYEGEGPVTVALPGSASTIALEPGDTYESDNEAEQEALDANPDLSSGKRAKKSDKKDD